MYIFFNDVMSLKDTLSVPSEFVSWESSSGKFDKSCLDFSRIDFGSVLFLTEEKPKVKLDLLFACPIICEQKN
jgi:hypothetical protein